MLYYNWKITTEFKIAVFKFWINMKKKMCKLTFSFFCCCCCINQTLWQSPRQIQNSAKNQLRVNFNVRISFVSLHIKQKYRNIQKNCVIITFQILKTQKLDKTLQKTAWNLQAFIKKENTTCISSVKLRTWKNHEKQFNHAVFNRLCNKMIITNWIVNHLTAYPDEVTWWY